MRSIIISRSILAILTNLVATIRDQYRDAKYLKYRILDEIEIFLSERDYYFVKITQSTQITHQLFSVFHDYVIFYLSYDLDNISKWIQLIPYLHNILFLSTICSNAFQRFSRVSPCSHTMVHFPLNFPLTSANVSERNDLSYRYLQFVSSMSIKYLIMLLLVRH